MAILNLPFRQDAGTIQAGSIKHMVEPTFRGEDVALFIDWENFKISLAAGRRNPNVSALKEEVSNHGRVVVAKAYADWVTRAPELRGASQFINDPPALYAAGIDPVYVPTRLAAGNGSHGDSGRFVRVKNSVDVKMTVDCIEYAHSYPNIRTFVLVSGDSDFIHVINTLRTMGKRVIIIGVSWATSRRLSDQVDELILYDVDVDAVTPVEPVSVAGNGRTEPQPRHTPQTQPAKIELPQIIKAIEEIVRAERQAGGTPLLTSIKQRLMRRFPEFDEKKVGFSGFKKLMSRVAEEGQIRLITAGLVDWAIMADEPEPEEPHTRHSGPVARAASPRGRQSSGRGRSSKTVTEDTSEEPAAGPTAEAAETTQVEDRQEAEPVAAESALPTAARDEPEQPSESEQVPVNAAVAIESEEEETATDEDTPGPEPVRQPDIDLDALLTEALPALDLPAGPDDGLNGRRVADLIVMADTLEGRDDVSHVAFNFLVGEVCQALDEGLKAEYEEITSRWGKAYTKTFVTKMVRGLGNGELFIREWRQVPDEDGGRSRRLSTFYLNREHPLVQGVLRVHWDSQDPSGTFQDGPEPLTAQPDAGTADADVLNTTDVEDAAPTAADAVNATEMEDTPPVVAVADSQGEGATLAAADSPA